MLHYRTILAAHAFQSPDFRLAPILTPPRLDFILVPARDRTTLCADGAAGSLLGHAAGPQRSKTMHSPLMESLSHATEVLEVLHRVSAGPMGPAKIRLRRSFAASRLYRAILPEARCGQARTRPLSEAPILLLERKRFATARSSAGLQKKWLSLANCAALEPFALFSLPSQESFKRGVVGLCGCRGWVGVAAHATSRWKISRMRVARY